MESIIPRKNPLYVWQEVEGEIILLNPESGKYFGLNSVGSSFWKKVDKNRTVEQIVHLMLNEYEVDKHILMQDIRELVTVLRNEGVLID